MNKLRALSWGGGGLVAVLAIWAAFYYGETPLRYATAILIGAVAACLPFGLAYFKSSVRSLRLRLADADEGFSAEKGSVFVSDATVPEPLEFLESVRAAVEADDEYDDVERDAFEEGPGLTVLHAGFHNSFVRITSAGHVVITGASERTHRLAETVGEVHSLSFDRTRNNPFDGMEPIKGGPRVFLGVLVFTIILVGIHTVTVAAYPASAYNPAERAVLVGVDASAALDPGTTENDARLTKAAFLAAIVDEASTEVRWAQNDSGEIAKHGKNALHVSDDARSLLAAVENGSPTAAQVERADRIERRLSDAERSVAAALDERAASDDVDDEEALHRLSDRLTASANESARVDSRDPVSWSSPRGGEYSESRVPLPLDT